MKNINTLIVTIEGGGNIPPIFGFGKKLLERGYSITILSEPCMKKPAIKLGAQFVAFKDHFLRKNRKDDLFQDWNASKLRNPIFERVMFGPAQSVVKQSVEVIRTHSIDLMVVDILLFPALIAAKHMKIPILLLNHMPEILPGPNRPPGNMGLKPGNGFMFRLRDIILGKLMMLKFNEYRSNINNILEELSMEPLDNTIELINKADLKLIQTLKSFDVPIEPSPTNVRYTGPVLDDPDWAANEQLKSISSDQKKKPLVVVSFSSTFQNQANAIQNCVNALADLDINGYVTLGPAMEDLELICPDNVTVMRSVKHSLLFPSSDLVITHGGHGTIMRALANGLPLICLPMGRDQDDNAIKVELRECGVKLSPKSNSDRIKKAIKQILSNPKYRQNALNMKNKITSNSGMEDIMIEIDNLVASNKTLKPEKI